ncbi:hypothetical protein ONS95_012997 [Cadophora gregata]|uniref:uncharacterized protein n=1 Tax=Cadophora gregata TaxID=51156 RepID=UPI0026DDA4CA|nr:uncharacterized protein ONS95_012997 [Cadophora gregata]KAK0101015.1 hypothetical protein ONS96_006246 [Cadophora gregata f. sp. sojae]KAK0115955.1 hypothetical protein ONS95_012997 [Cadophora gregata]
MEPVEDTKHFIPFALLIRSRTLILVPALIAKTLPTYRAFFASLHASKEFCEMGFGQGFPARSWSDEETLAALERSWKRDTEMGDFAVGRLAEECDLSRLKDCEGRELGKGMQEVVILVGHDLDLLHMESVDWVGYAGVRDASTTSMPPRASDDPPLPPWREMVELRYGVAQKCWGSGIARTAAEAVMRWAVVERGVRRFIAETERDNSRSGRVLEKLGFTPSGTNYWKDPGEIEWEKVPHGMQ